jgi:hypothetical protein
LKCPSSEAFFKTYISAQAGATNIDLHRRRAKRHTKDRHEAHLGDYQISERKVTHSEDSQSGRALTKMGIAAFSYAWSRGSFLVEQIREVGRAIRGERACHDLGAVTLEPHGKVGCSRLNRLQRRIRPCCIRSRGSTRGARLVWLPKPHPASYHEPGLWCSGPPNIVRDRNHGNPQ